jgi:hypothetical protein
MLYPSKTADHEPPYIVDLPDFSAFDPGRAEAQLAEILSACRAAISRHVEKDGASDWSLVEDEIESHDALERFWAILSHLHAVADNDVVRGAYNSCLAALTDYSSWPKILSPWRLEEEWFDWQRVHRFAGWLAATSGVALVLVWLALPLPVARPATVRILAAFLVLAVGRKWLSVADYARRRPPARPLETSSDSFRPD